MKDAMQRVANLSALPADRGLRVDIGDMKVLLVRDDEAVRAYSARAKCSDPAIEVSPTSRGSFRRARRALHRSDQRAPRSLDRTHPILNSDQNRFEVLLGDETVATAPWVELPNSRALWPRVAELANKAYDPGCRIRVTDESGAIVIFIGVATARLCFDVGGFDERAPGRGARVQV